MTLVERSEALRDRVKALGRTRGALNEERALKEFCNAKLARPKSRLAAIKRYRTAFAVHSLPWPAKWVPDMLAQEVRNLLAAFNRSRARATLVLPDGWPAVEGKLLPALSEVEQKALEAWSAFCATKVPNEHPGELRSEPVIGLHASNLPLLGRYETSYQVLARLSSIVPDKAADIADFLEQAERASALLAQLKREPLPKEEMPPDEVRRFLAAVSAGPVTLDLVTPAVLNWLGERNRLEGFSVQTKIA